LKVPIFFVSSISIRMVSTRFFFACSTLSPHDDISNSGQCQIWCHKYGVKPCLVNKFRYLLFVIGYFVTSAKVRS
jgi:hypothetical protein